MKLSKEIPYKTWVLNGDGTVSPILKDLEGILDMVNAPRQILPKTYYQDGYIDIFPFKTIVKFNSTSGIKVEPFFIDEFSLDIDSIDDLEKINSYFNSHTLPKWVKLPTRINQN
jgi:CMP-N-acetylneuraminic acid synthetase